MGAGRDWQRVEEKKRKKKHTTFLFIGPTVLNKCRSEAVKRSLLVTQGQE